ncbi:alpha-2-macroglobulin family protein [Pontimicrobium sp. MEBiC06410]
MKQYITLLMIILFANTSLSQNNNYDKLWKAVEKLELEGLPKSALEKVDAIAIKAKADNNHSQRIKTLLYKSKFILILEENAQLKVITDLKAEINTSEIPVKNVLENILANLYWQYYQQNRYKFYNRTKTETKVDTVDFRTWDLQTLFNEIHLHFTNSLQNGLILQQTKLEVFDELLITQEGSKTYRPTLFDFLSHNALSFYSTSEHQITKPAYKFEIDNPHFLVEAERFSKLNINSKDTTSQELNALKIYQELMAFHIKDKTPYALADVNIKRLKYVLQHAIFNNKDRLFLEALHTEKVKHSSHEVSALYSFEIANKYYQQGQTYNPKTAPENRFKLKEALALCNTAINTFPKSKGAEKCTVLKSRILNPSLEITTEGFLPIQTNARLLLKYSNLDHLLFQAYKISEKQYETFKTIYREDEKQKFIKKLNATTNWNANLINEGDYQKHTIEVSVPKLDNGRYLITAKTLELETNFLSTAIIQVTNIATVEYQDDNYKYFQFIHRNTGAPLVNTAIELTYHNYGKKEITEHVTTDALGHIKIKYSKKRRTNLKLKAVHKNDVGYFGNYNIYRGYTYNNDTKKSYNSGFIFTDRSIYRPGQTIYFKGIIMKTEDEKSTVLANEKVAITLSNVNGEKIKTLDLVTNEFGSVSETFILPNDGLTGNFSIRLNGDNISAYHSISVEEYKRPKFETKFNPITETIKINDSVTVKGEALAFAGSNITDAKVVYRVKRNVQYPRWYYWYNRHAYSSEAQEITKGETITDAKGHYQITFKAIPDESVDKSSLPIFNYEVTADVTDVNGETRSTTTIVKVGYHALTATVTVDPKLDKTNKKQTLSIDTKNLNGEFVAAKGAIKIYKLLAPDYVLRPRPWTAPDYDNYTKTEFKTLFPHDAYNDEDNSNNWKKGKLVLDDTFNTEKSKTIALGNMKRWESGEYIIELETKDRFGQLVKDQTKTILYSNQDKVLADKQLFSITTDKKEYKAGDNAIITVASAAENITVTLTVEKDRKLINTHTLTLNNNKKTITVPVTKDDLGGFAVAYSFSAFNSFQNGATLINVPYPKTELTIETKTFRDKLQPGTDETWSFKIKGPKGEQVSAELLASMYDASLDEFKAHNYNFNPIVRNTYRPLFVKNSRLSYNTQNFRIIRKTYAQNYPSTQQYDSWHWFGFNFGNFHYQRQRYLRSIQTKTPSSYTSTHKSGIKKGYIEGVVLDNDKVPIPSANILLKGTSTGTLTDFDGKFKLEVKNGKTLQFSFIGYKTLNVPVTKDNYYTVTLIEDNAILEEVIVMADESVQRSMQVKSAAAPLRARVSGMQIEMEAAEESATVLNDDEFNDFNYYRGNKYSKKTFNDHKRDNQESFNEVSIRKNLQETAFFFPQLQTDKDGNVSFNFTTPEALTKWKLQLLAHTKTLESATKTLETVTQKELMVLPNAPRFLREGDNIKISTKIANLTKKQLSGQAILQLFDALSGKAIDTNFNNANNRKEFTVGAKGNTQVTWSLNVPTSIQAVQYKIIAKSGDYSDGEQNALPVLTNRMLVTETLPMWIKSNETKTFTLDKLKTNTSTTLKNHKLTLEITSNPAWYAVQALPYLMEYPYECNEQTFSRYYANALASHIANSNPRIQDVFNQWKNTDALLSNLEKNQELKSLLIQETPWLRDAQSETEQKKRIALLFDLNKMDSELARAKRKLEANQMGSGAWSWFANNRENRFITQHIITGFGHLKQLNVKASKEDTASMIEKALRYLDAEFVQEYKDIRKYNKNVDLSLDHLSYTQLHYLYMRSFFNDIKTSKEVDKIIAYYQSQIKKYWLSRSLYSKGMMALIMHRADETTTANKILKSLKENSITSEELGMYWKTNTSSWYWYQAPIETQALLIEAFSEIENDTETIDNLKVWLLKNKQTNQWKTTKATTDAVYALLLQGSDWLSVTEMVEVIIGGQPIAPNKLENVKVEAGTGYYKTAWNGSEIKPEQAEVTLTKKGKGIAWGSVYWQYFEDLDKITSAETPLKLKKKLFKKTNGDTGEIITEINKDTPLKVGDLVRVRIELRSDRAMEFVHMKDMRAAGMEPINVLSSYKYQDGLGYYESTKDASTNFFFDYLPKGVYVFEYDLRVNNAGNMSNGITTIQSMYAPEFTSHSEGVRVTIE